MTIQEVIKAGYSSADRRHASSNVRVSFSLCGSVAIWHVQRVANGPWLQVAPGCAEYMADDYKPNGPPGAVQWSPA